MKIRSMVRRVARDNRGANMVEYIILVGIVAILAIVAFRFFNNSIKAKVNEEANSVNKINGVE